MAKWLLECPGELGRRLSVSVDVSELWDISTCFWVQRGWALWGVLCVYLSFSFFSSSFFPPRWIDLVVFTVLVPGNNVIPEAGTTEETTNQRTARIARYINTTERIGRLSFKRKQTRSSDSELKKKKTVLLTSGLKTSELVTGLRFESN